MIEAEIDCVNKYSIYKQADIKEPTKKPVKNIWVMKFSGKTSGKHPIRHYHLSGCIGLMVHRFNNAPRIFKILQFEKPDNNMRPIFIILIQLDINRF